jgi:hypothetical protein
MPSRPDTHLSIVPYVRMMCHTVWTLDRSSTIRSDDVDFRPDPPLYREASIPACIRSEVSAARPDASQYLTKLQILSKFIYGKIAATVRMMWIPVRMRFSLRQESQFKFNRPDTSLPSSGRACIWYGNCGFNFNRPDACQSWSGCAHHRYRNCVLKINRLDGHPPWFGCAKALNGNYLQRTWDRLDDSTSPSGRGSQTGKIFNENLKNSGRTVVLLDDSGSPSGRHPYILQ